MPKDLLSRDMRVGDAGRYRVIRLLGEGGMSQVYLAQDTRLSDRQCAVKRTNATLSPTDFHHEAQVLARLNHPALTNVSDFFEEKGWWYLVMDYAEGRTLEEALKEAPRQRVAEEQVITWGLQLCDILAYLHGQSPPVIYRDLKPSNVIVTPTGSLKLIDFGIARFFKPGQASDTLPLGTEGYASPEHHGRRQTDARSDVYSLGVLLHQMVTGYDPADVPFNLPPARHLNPAVSPQLEVIVSQATQVNPEDRFQSIVALRAALSAAQTQAPVSCPRCGAQVRASAHFCQSCGYAVKPTKPGRRPAAESLLSLKPLLGTAIGLVLLLLLATEVAGLVWGVPAIRHQQALEQHYRAGLAFEAAGESASALDEYTHAGAYADASIRLITVQAQTNATAEAQAAATAQVAMAITTAQAAPSVTAQARAAATGTAVVQAEATATAIADMAEHYQRGVDYFEQRQWQAAQREFAQVAHTDPDYLDTATYLEQLDGLLTPWYVRIYNIDDLGIVYVNDQEVVRRLKDEEDTGWVPVPADWLMPESNTFSFSVKNTYEGYTWGFSIRRGGDVLDSWQAGTVNVWGANNDDHTRGWVWSKRVVVDIQGHILSED